MKKVICLLLIAVLMLCGCGTKIEEKKGTSASAPSKEPTSVSAASIEKSSVSVKNKKATPACVKIKKVAANYFSGKELKGIKVQEKSIIDKNKYFSCNIKYPIFMGEKYKSFNKLVEKVVREKSSYNEFFGSSKDDEDYPYHSKIEVSYKVRKLTNQFISISFEGSISSGHMCHVYNIIFCINYDLQNENDIKLSNVVSNMDDFSKEMLKAIKAQMKTKDVVEDYQHAWKFYEKEDLKKSHDFYISDGKLYCLVQIPAGSGPYEFVGISKSKL